MSLRRTSSPKIVGVLLSSVVVVSVAAYLWFRAIEARRWSDMEATLVGLEREADARPGELLDLEDPFRGKLFHVVKEGRLKLWSRGRDGVDDAGLGDWRARSRKDIVLEVTR